MPGIRVAIAGSTGSIGTQTLDVLGANPDQFELTALAASGRDIDQLVEQARAGHGDEHERRDHELEQVVGGRHARRL